MQEEQQGAFYQAALGGKSIGKGAFLGKMPLYTLGKFVQDCLCKNLGKFVKIKIKKQREWEDSGYRGRFDV